MGRGGSRKFEWKISDQYSLVGPLKHYKNIERTTGRLFYNENYC